MAEYLLKITGSNEVVNIVYYDGTGSFDAPDGYYFEVLTVDQNLISMSYFVSESFAPESLDDIPYYHGNISGIFSGELTGSILVNGKLFDNIFNETAFGELLLLSGSDIGYASQSNGFYASENNIQLPISNLNYEKQHRYYDVLNNIIDNNISNYVITFKNKYDPEVNFQYLVLNTELTSSGTSSYYDIQGSVVYTSSFEKYGINPFFENHKNHNPEWHIDFDLGDKPIVGQVYVNGDKLEKVLNQTKYGQILYNPSTNTEVFPTLHHFTTSIPANEWSSTSPIRIAISNILQGQYTAGFYFEWALNNILENGLIGSIIRFESDVWPLTYKFFEITNIIEYGWDNTGYFYRTIKTTTPIYDASLSTKWPAGSPPVDPVKYYEMEVTELASSTDALDYNIMPEENEFFNVDFEFEESRSLEIIYIDDSKDWTMPAWATKLTVICIGAGGGGGGGGAGYLHEYPHGMWTEFSDNDIPRTIGKKIGHDIIMGGGGGAGGNIAWTVYDNVPPGTKFIATVGEGGLGSRGCWPDEELEFLLEDVSTYRGDIRKSLTEFIFPQQLQTRKSMSAYSDYMTKVIKVKDSAIRGITAPNSFFKPFNAGDNGGYTSFKSKLTTGYQVDVSADGGIGGVTGTGIRHYVHQYHLICWSDEHGYI
jgi:hypothetical protein